MDYQSARKAKKDAVFVVTFHQFRSYPSYASVLCSAVGYSNDQLLRLPSFDGHNLSSAFNVGLLNRKKPHLLFFLNCGQNTELRGHLRFSGPDLTDSVFDFIKTYVT